MKREKTYEVELRDLYQDSPYWTRVKVAYEPEHCGSGEIEWLDDEFGKEWRLEDLSEHDRDIVEKALIFELSADQMMIDLFKDLNREWERE